MQLKITGLHNEGDETREYVYMLALEDCNLKNYAVADTTYGENGKISNKLRHFYWFGTYDVKKGERVVLYTKPGKQSQGVTTNGVTVHRFYWGLKVPVWNNAEDGAILFEIAKWKTTQVG